jgi:hypothetical protein
MRQISTNFDKNLQNLAKLGDALVFEIFWGLR